MTLSSQLKKALALLLAVWASVVWSGGELVQTAAPPLQDNLLSNRYLARVELNNPSDVEAALRRAETFYHTKGMDDNVPPVVFVLHGPEVGIFLKENYQQYKGIVDLAARLHAFRVVDVKVCQARMKSMEADEANLYPFVGTVPFGPAEVERLITEEKYVYF